MYVKSNKKLNSSPSNQFVLKGAQYSVVFNHISKQVKV